MFPVIQLVDQRPIRRSSQSQLVRYASVETEIHARVGVEYLLILEGSATFTIEIDGVQKVELQKSDTVELHPGVWHAFTTSSKEVTRLLGIHLSPERIVYYKPGVKTDARGFRVTDDAATISESASGG